MPKEMNQEDEFDKEFDALLENQEEDEEEREDDDPATDDQDESTDEDDKDEAGEAEEETDTDEEEEESDDDDKKENDSTSDIEALKAELELERQRFRSFEGRIRAEKERERQEREAQGQDRKSDEDDPLAEFKENFPDMVAPIEALVQERAQALLQDFQERHVNPSSEVVQRLSQQAHFEAIGRAHPDFQDLAPKVNDWVASQPSFIRPRLEQVVQGGSTEEVIELLDTYKKDRGVSASNGQEANERKTSDEKARQMKRKKAKAVPGRPGPAPSSGIDQDDFDGAWRYWQEKGVG
jgi:hypothetical protein